jgi:hypothetical protein
MSAHLFPNGKVPPYTQNEDESSIFLIKLSNLVTLIAMGTLVTEREGFHLQRYI